ncbi:uncharacterized protein LOC135471457 [Liolophura sinensis]|uniref:uncharacterized protein LOC135471457 n=1 Tax=Liolophura sinensis TaxID=3198878 RepID=UPI003158EFC0
MAEARAVVGQWAKKHDKLGNASRRLLRQSMDATFSPVTSPRGSMRRSPSKVSHARSRQDRVEKAARSANGPVESQAVESGIIILSDSEDLDEESQMELAIMLSLSESSNPSPAMDANRNLTGNLGCPGSSRDVNSVAARDQSSSSAVPGQEGKENQTFRCSILNCEAIFSSESGLAAHYAGLCHSPCNPCLLLQDLKPPNQVLAYTCPQCGRQFKDESKCSDHMSRRNHRPFIPSLAVCGYMCPQCLATFSDHNTCQEHMETFHHTDITYSFEDDMQCLPPTPVPVSLGFLQDFITECSKVESSLFCIDCCAAVECNQCESHRESNPAHIVSSSASRSLSEVFMEYLNSSQCDHCGVILSSHEGALGDVHTCVEGHVGKLRETKVRTFAEFVRLMGVKFRIQSVGELVTLSASFNSSQTSLVDSMKNCSVMSIEILSASCSDENTVRDDVVIDSPDVRTTKLCKKRRRSSVICLDSPETGYKPKRNRRAAETVARPLFGRNSKNNKRKRRKSPDCRTVTDLVETVSIEQEKGPVKGAPLSVDDKGGGMSRSSLPTETALACHAAHVGTGTSETNPSPFSTLQPLTSQPATGTSEAKPKSIFHSPTSYFSTRHWHKRMEPQSAFHSPTIYFSTRH